MWSRRFAAVGVSSAAIFAALSVFAMCLVFYLVMRLAMRSDPNSLAIGIFDFSLCFAAGVFVYPACWFSMIQRKRDYGVKRTFDLAWATFGISCVTVGALFCLAVAVLSGTMLFVGVVKMISGALEPSWQVLQSSLLFLGLVVGGGPMIGLFFTFVGGVIALPAFAAIAVPTAYLHRWLLLKMFASDGANTLQITASP